MLAECSNRLITSIHKRESSEFVVGTIAEYNRVNEFLHFVLADVFLRNDFTQAQCRAKQTSANSTWLFVIFEYELGPCALLKCDHFERVVAVPTDKRKIPRRQIGKLNSRRTFRTIAEQTERNKVSWLHQTSGSIKLAVASIQHNAVIGVVSVDQATIDECDEQHSFLCGQRENRRTIASACKIKHAKLAIAQTANQRVLIEPIERRDVLWRIENLEFRGEEYNALGDRHSDTIAENGTPRETGASGTGELDTSNVLCELETA